MAGFKSRSSGFVGWLKWNTDPDDDAAQRTMIKWLSCVVPAGFLSVESDFSNRIKGNLGEFIAYKIGREYAFTEISAVSGANTTDPLADISRPDVDIVWLNIGQNQTDDWAVLQEVKTTGEPSLRLADLLISDYDKLFGENVSLTLPSRLTVLKNKLEQLGQGHLSSRITALTAPSPDLANRIRLIPTLLHDGENDPSAKMVSVRQALIGRGWLPAAVECWSIAIGEIDERLGQIAKGKEQ